MIKLYGTQGPNVAKTRAGLTLKQLDFKHVEVNIVDPPSAFRELTPIRKIPVVQDGDFVVNDSLAIAEYLDRQYPDAYSLFPETLQARVSTYTIIALLERAFLTIAPVVAKELGFFALGEARAACSGYHEM